MGFTPETQHIHDIVALTQRRLKRNYILTGLLLCLGATLAWLLLSTVVDMLTPMSVFFRVIAAAVFWALFIGFMIVMVVRPTLRPPAIQDVAFRIERTIPGMHNRLITVLDLQQQNGHAKSDPAFFERLVQQTTIRLGQFRPEKLVSKKPVRRGAAGLATVVSLIVVLTVFCSERMPAAIKRVLLPTASIAPGSWVKLKADPGNVEVLQGEPVVLRATFVRGHADDVMIRVNNDGGEWYTYPMKADERGNPSFNISSVTKSTDYQITGGGTWTDIHRVTMLRRPVIEKIVTGVRLPAYMGIPDARPVDENATQVSAPVGSTIDLVASVTGEPQRGQINLYKASQSSGEELREQEAVWFDDDLPPDVQETGPWKWTTEQVYSGARAHTFGWRRKPYGFTTRLSKLTLAPEASFFAYVWIDPHDKAERLTISLTVDPQVFVLAWGSTPKAGTPPKGLVVEMGDMPVAGKWVRVEVPVLKMLPGRAAPVPVSAIEFGIDKGRVYFDRVGSILRKKETVQKTTLEATGTLPMTRDLATGQWVGHLPVQVDGSYAMEFFNTRGAANVPMKPMPLLATVDQPPTVLVERPGKSITIDKAEPVPMMVRAFDDYGVADIGLQIGATADKFNEATIIAKYAQPQQNPLVISSIDPRLMALAPGASAYYRLVVHDRKGQVAYSEAYRLGLAAPGAAAADMDKGVTPLQPLFDGLNKLLNIQSQAALMTAQLTATLNKDAPPTTQPIALEFKNPDGSPMTPEQIKAMLAQKFNQLTPQEQAQATALDKKLTEERLAAYALTQQLNAAAMQAQQSAMAVPLEAAALQEMSKQLEHMQAEKGDDTAMDKAVKDRLAKLNELTPEQQKEMTELQAELQKLQAARQQAANNPQAAQAQLQRMLAQMQANQASRSVGKLNNSLQSQREQLAQLRKQMAAMQERTKDAPGKDLNGISKDQGKLDAAAIEKMKQAQDLLRERLAGREEKQDDPMLEPWRPPGEVTDAVPVEHDTPEKKDPNKKPDPAAAGDAAKQAEKDKEKENWWDKPAEVPPTGSTTEDDPRFANRDKRPIQPGEKDDAASTPREQLEQHQQNFQHHLSDDEAALASAEQQLGQMSQEMANLMAQMNGQGQSDAQGQGQNQSQSQSQSQGQNQGQGQGQDQSQSQAMAQLQQMMSSPQMQWAMAASQRAAMASQQPGQQNGAAVGATGRGTVTAQTPMRMDFGSIELGTQGALLYRLPPRVREPLIQGMQERGPEAYQRLIDAYYRQLSKDVK